MRKAYESPKAEKMAFDYSDVVVASGHCSMETKLKDAYDPIVRCEDYEYPSFTDHY